MTRYTRNGRRVLRDGQPYAEGVTETAAQSLVSLLNAEAHRMRLLQSYPGEVSERIGYGPGKSPRYEKTGEFRPPRKGEHYLSGAIPCAYRAPNDLGTAYHIMRPIEETP